MVGTYGVAKVLMSPAFARWLYTLPKTVAGIPRDVAVQRGLVSLGQALATGGQQHTPGQPVTRPKEPKVSDRIGAARRVGELSTQIYEAKRRGDLDEAQTLMRELASAQAEYNRLKVAA